MRFILTLICLNKKVSSTESHQLQKFLQFNCKHTPCLSLEMLKSILPLPRAICSLLELLTLPKSSPEHSQGGAHSYTDVCLYIWMFTGPTGLSSLRNSKHACACSPQTYKMHWNQFRTQFTMNITAAQKCFSPKGSSAILIFPSPSTNFPSYFYSASNWRQMALKWLLYPSLRGNKFPQSKA